MNGWVRLGLIAALVAVAVLRPAASVAVVLALLLIGVFEAEQRRRG